MDYQEIFQAHYESPLGWLTLSADLLGICRLSFGKNGTPRGVSTHIERAKLDLDCYFSGEKIRFLIPLNLKGTPFQKAVWKALAEIPYGAFPSYSDIAASIGKPSAARAVGMAINANPVPIILPCHRVIGKDGSLTGYSAGLDIKRSLLRLELNQQEVFITKSTVSHISLHA